MSAVYRESTYPQLTPMSSRLSSWIKIPSFGTIILLLLYLASILALEFTNNNIPGGQHYQALGVRAAWLAVVQFPLLMLLAGKNNLIGLFTGQSYERLNILHRWVSRGMLLLATLHFGYQSVGWNEYGLMVLEWTTDTCPPTGMAAYALLLWLNLSTLAPFRNMWYEFFVVQHLLSFFGFVIAIMIHLPSTALYSRVYVYIPIALWFVDRLIRSARYALHNARPSKATLTPLSGGVTKIRVTAPKSMKNWSPGAWVLLSIPKFGLGQSHPATILSTPESHGGDLVFLLKSHKGFTARINTSPSTESVDSLLPSSAEKEEATTAAATYTALIDGPYGTTPWDADLATYTTVVLIAGSTGITHTIAHLLSLAHRASSSSSSSSSSSETGRISRLPLRTIHFIHLIKSLSHVSWLSSELQSAIDALRAAGIDVNLRIYVTCDDAMTDADTTSGLLGAKISGCGCDRSLGPCCCTSMGQMEINSVVRAFAQTRRGGVGVGDEKKEADGAITSILPPTFTSGDKGKGSASAVVRAASSSSSTSSPSSPSYPSYTNTNTAELNTTTIHPSRPNLPQLLHTIVAAPAAVEGETGVVVCGSIGLSAAVRNAVVRVSDERAVHKGSGAQGIRLWVESYSW